MAERGPSWSFDVAVSPAGLRADGSRQTTRRWVRVVVSAPGLVEAHLVAAQLVGVHGMVTDVLYRE